ncbi:MAG: hypothetical protein HZLCBSQH_001394 [Candidatus Fervidibacterota bacterium]
MGRAMGSGLRLDSPLAAVTLLHRRRQQIGLPPLIFVSSDEGLLAAAQAEGLMTENPN